VALLVVVMLASACGLRVGGWQAGPDITIGPDRETSGNSWGRNVSKQFDRSQLGKLYAVMNSDAAKKEIAALNCGKELPRHEYSVTLWPEGEVQERQVRLQMTPRLYKDDDCLQHSVNYVFQRAVKGIDPGPPIDYGYKDPQTGAHLDTSHFAEELPDKPACKCAAAN
jgi:hypothetical protein